MANRFDRFSWLLVSMLVLIVVEPIIAQSGIESASILIWLLLVYSLVSAVWAVADSRRLVVVLSALGAAVILLRLFDTDFTDGRVALFRTGLVAIFFSLVAITIVKHVLSSERVTSGVISAALCVYVLFGYVWALLYSIIAAVDGSAFTLASPALPDLVYFSFVTLVTLGYGDIAPVSAVARGLAIVESVTGAFYLAVLISRLVAMHILHSKEPPSK